MWPAFWMLGTDIDQVNWPQTGEIDIMEHVGYEPGRIHASTHSRKNQWRNNTQRTAITEVPDAVTAFHTYALEWEPLTYMGRLFGKKLARQAAAAVGKRIESAVAFLKGGRLTMFDLPPPQLPEGARARAMAAAEQVDRGPYGNGLGAPIAEHVMTAMASDLTHLKPKLLARRLGVEQRPAIEACLASVKAGLLTMKWDLLCTSCRGPKLTALALSELPRGAHCDSCNIDYDRDFERNVELSFSPAPTVRPLLAGGYCLSGPMSTPHVPLQLLLAPGERREIALDLPAGSYRLRTLHPGGHTDVEHEGGAFPGLRVTASGVEAMPPGAPGKIAFVNDAGFECAALIEDRTWTKDALTAPEVVTLQAFRDLFAEATLRPGRASLRRRRCMAARSWSMLSGSISSAASPATSGSAETREVVGPVVDRLVSKDHSG